MNNSDHRRFKRLETCITTSFSLYDKAGIISKEGNATAINISKTGMLLQTQTALIPNEKIDITMNLPIGLVHLKCQCMYCSESEKSSFESGIQVLKINKKEIKSYLDYIQSLEKQSRTSKSLRPQSGNITDVVKRISAEHKIINQYVIVLAKLLKKPSPSPMETESLIQLMKQDIATHFKIEENLFFSVGLITLPGECAQIISALTEDHRTIIEAIGSLLESLQYQIKNSGPLTPPLMEKIRELLEVVKQHAKVELQELFPLIEGNAEAKKMILEKIREITRK